MYAFFHVLVGVYMYIYMCIIFSRVLFHIFIPEKLFIIFAPPLPLLLLHCARMSAGPEANMSKYLAAEASWKTGDVCVQTHGGPFGAGIARLIWGVARLIWAVAR